MRNIACHALSMKREWESEWVRVREGVWERVSDSVRVSEWEWVSEWVMSEREGVSECEWVRVSMIESEWERVRVREWERVTECEWVSEWDSELERQWLSEWVIESECVRETVSERKFEFVLCDLLNLSNASVIQPYFLSLVLVARVKDDYSKGTGVHYARCGRKSARKTELYVLWHSIGFPSSLSVLCVFLCMWLRWKTTRL
jgi:hypothetical protein